MCVQCMCVFSFFFFGNPAVSNVIQFMNNLYIAIPNVLLTIYYTSKYFSENTFLNKSQTYTYRSISHDYFVLTILRPRIKGYESTGINPGIYIL